MIGIIDYGAGNLGSVKKAFEYLGAPYGVIADAGELDASTGVVLPGVGAFGAAVEKLKDRGFFPVLRDYITADQPFLGICLGMQLLMDSSEEAPGKEGLGIINGTCIRFREGKVPQMGWNRVLYKKNSSLFNGIPEGSFFYFVHSYHVQEADPRWAAACTDYYTTFTSVFESGNCCAVQFHPEKSGEVGLQMLRNWLGSREGIYNAVKMRRDAKKRSNRMIPMGNTLMKHGTMFDRESKIFAGSRVHLQCGIKECPWRRYII